jgi:hypothetical protein
MIGAAIQRISRPWPRASVAKNTEATKAASIGTNRVWRATGWSCQNPKSKEGDFGPFTAHPRNVQNQTATQPAVRLTRAHDMRRPPIVRTPSSCSGSVAVQLGRVATAPMIVSPHSTTIAPKLKKAYLGNIRCPPDRIMRTGCFHYDSLHALCRSAVSSRSSFSSCVVLLAAG